MRTTLYQLLFLFSLVFLGCSEKHPNPNIVFENQSKKQLDSIVIFSDVNCKHLIFKDIAQNATVDGEVELCNTNKPEGTYTITIYEKGNVILEKGFGSYKNGANSNSGFKLAYSPGILTVESE